MKAEDLKVGECYLLPVTYTQEPFKGGNLVRRVTQDEGAVVWAHPEALLLDDRKKRSYDEH